MSRFRTMWLAEGARRLLWSPLRMRSCMAFASSFWRPVSSFNLVKRVIADHVDLWAEVCA